MEELMAACSHVGHGPQHLWDLSHPCGTPKDTALCGLSPENLRLQQEECVQENAGCRMMGRSEDEELAGGFIPPG